jgi:hypothetical protein
LNGTLAITREEAMLDTLLGKDKRCYLLVAYAPSTITIADANLAFNDFIADERRGFVLFHDHFVRPAGGIAIFALETKSQLQALQEPHPLADWAIQCHPLVYANSQTGFLYQADFTMTFYRQKRLAHLFAEYDNHDLRREIDRIEEKLSAKAE